MEKQASCLRPQIEFKREMKKIQHLNSNMISIPNKAKDFATAKQEIAAKKLLPVLGKYRRKREPFPSGEETEVLFLPPILA